MSVFCSNPGGIACSELVLLKTAENDTDESGESEPEELSVRPENQNNVLKEAKTLHRAEDNTELVIIVSGFVTVSDHFHIHVVM